MAKVGQLKLRDDLPSGGATSYNDLTDKPTIPSQLSQLTTDPNNQRVSEVEKATYTNKADQSFAIAMAVAL